MSSAARFDKLTALSYVEGRPAQPCPDWPFSGTGFYQGELAEPQPVSHRQDACATEPTAPDAQAN